jgi:phage gp36-like protein
MAYSTPADVRNILTADGDPADQESPNPTSDADFTDAITQADGEVDLYLGSRYVVPVAPGVAPEPVRTWSRVIAAWNIYGSWHKGQAIDVNDPMRLRYARVQALLAAVASGQLDIPGLSLLTTAGANAIVPVNQYEGQFWPNSITRPAVPYPYGGSDELAVSPFGIDPVGPGRYG